MMAVDFGYDQRASLARGRHLYLEDVKSLMSTRFEWECLLYYTKVATTTTTTGVEPAMPVTTF